MDSGLALRAPRNDDHPRRSRNSCGVVPVCLRKKRAKCEGSENDKLLGNVLDRLRGEDELALGFGEQALADQMAGGDAGCAFDVIVEPVDGHAELLGIEAELMLAAEILVDQRAQLRDRRVGRLQGDAAGARAACRKPRHGDRDQRQEAAHRHAIAFARQAAFLEQFRAQSRKPRALALAAYRDDRMRGERAQP